MVCNADSVCECFGETSGSFIPLYFCVFRVNRDNNIFANVSLLKCDRHLMKFIDLNYICNILSCVYTVPDSLITTSSFAFKGDLFGVKAYTVDRFSQGRRYWRVWEV